MFLSEDPISQNTDLTFQNWIESKKYSSSIKREVEKTEKGRNTEVLVHDFK